MNLHSDAVVVIINTNSWSLVPLLLPLHIIYRSPTDDSYNLSDDKSIFNGPFLFLNEQSNIDNYHLYVDLWMTVKKSISMSIRWSNIQEYFPSKYFIITFTALVDRSLHSSEQCLSLCTRHGKRSGFTHFISSYVIVLFHWIYILLSPSVSNYLLHISVSEKRRSNYQLSIRTLASCSREITWCGHFARNANFWSFPLFPFLPGHSLVDTLCSVYSGQHGGEFRCKPHYSLTIHLHRVIYVHKLRIADIHVEPYALCRKQSRVLPSCYVSQHLLKKFDICVMLNTVVRM